MHVDESRPGCSANEVTVGGTTPRVQLPPTPTGARPDYAPLDCSGALMKNNIAVSVMRPSTCLSARPSVRPSAVAEGTAVHVLATLQPGCLRPAPPRLNIIPHTSLPPHSHTCTISRLHLYPIPDACRLYFS